MKVLTIRPYKFTHILKLIILHLIIILNNYFHTITLLDSFINTNFSRSGIIKVSPDSRLDLDSGLNHYDVIVHAVDSGIPVPETATTTVHIIVQDINNKPPIFNLQNSTAYVSERAQINEKVIQIKATDPDEDAKIIYSIIEPIKAVDKNGLPLKSTNNYDYKTAFKINDNGEIFVNHSLDYQAAAVITLTIRAKDMKAVIEPEKQIAKTEVTIYIQAYSDDNPIFLNDGWSFSHPNIKVTVEEEKPIGTRILALKAKDPLTDTSIGMLYNN